MKNLTEKILIVGVDSQFVHSLLSIHYIYANTTHPNVWLFECNINMNVQAVATEILSQEPDIVAFSTYIFNIDFINLLSSKLRNCGVTVVYGGIEIENNIRRHENYCDYILVGDGEIVFDEFLFGDRSQKIVTASKKSELFQIKSPYTEKYFELTNGKIAYFEASRGCPFTCSYCMSANSKLSLSALSRVFADLEKFQGKNIRVLKFVDRTFNAKAEYSNAIVQYIIDNQDKYGYQIHFEIAPELINDALISLLKKAKPNFIRMEIGMQSLNAETLKKINRPFDVDKLQMQIKKLCDLKNIDTHVDIIAGLPLENFISLTRTFDLLFALAPTEIQLGMLKMLPGSPLSKEDVKGYIFENSPPYQITQSAWLNKDEIEEILKTEQVVNRIHNSGRFKLTLKYSFSYFQARGHNFSSPFLMFNEFAKKYNGGTETSLFELYNNLLEFLTDEGIDRSILIDLMRFDFASTNNSRALPKCLFVKYNKKFNLKVDKSRSYIVPIFHDIFHDFAQSELLLAFDYLNFDNLNKHYFYQIIS